MIFIVVPNYSEETDVHDIPARTEHRFTRFDPKQRLLVLKLSS